MTQEEKLELDRQIPAAHEVMDHYRALTAKDTAEQIVDALANASKIIGRHHGNTTAHTVDSTQEDAEVFREIKNAQDRNEGRPLINKITSI